MSVVLSVPIHLTAAGQTHAAMSDMDLPQLRPTSALMLRQLTHTPLLLLVLQHRIKPTRSTEATRVCPRPKLCTGTTRADTTPLLLRLRRNTIIKQADNLTRSALLCRDSRFQLMLLFRILSTDRAAAGHRRLRTMSTLTRITTTVWQNQRHRCRL